jgi:hypothetical protein
MFVPIWTKSLQRHQLNHKRTSQLKMLIQPGFLKQCGLKVVISNMQPQKKYFIEYISGALLVDALRLAFVGALTKICDFVLFCHCYEIIRRVLRRIW